MRTGGPSGSRDGPVTPGRLSLLSAGAKPLFVYGTLMFPAVLDVLLGRVPATRPAGLDGWRVAALPGRSYPALVPGERRADGKVLLDLRPEEWRIIDAYEDDVYDLCRIELVPPAGEAVAYVCPSTDDALDQDWDRDRFAAEELPAFVRRCARWRRQAFPRA